MPVNKVRNWLRIERESENGGRVVFDDLQVARASVACDITPKLSQKRREAGDFDRLTREVRDVLTDLADGEAVPYRHAAAIAAALR